VKRHKKDFLLGIASGAFCGAGMSFLHPQLVMAAFIYELTGSKLLVGIASSLTSAGMLWPQLFVSSRIEHQPRKKPFYIINSICRIVMLASLAGTMWLVGIHRNAWLISLFFLIYFMFRTSQGCGQPLFFDIVGQAILSNRLGSFFAYRALFGSLLALFCGFFAVQPILRYVAFPGNYALLVAGTLILTGTGWTVFMFTHEDANNSPPAPRNLRQTFTGSAQMLLRDKNYRLLLFMRFCVRINMLALVFYVPYGVDRLGVIGLSGIFVGMIQASRLASSLFWGKLSNRAGNCMCLKVAAFFFTAAPVMALVAPHIPAMFQWPIPGTAVSLDAPLLVYLGALCLFGVATQGYRVSANAFLIESAPPERRPSYIAFLNTVSLPLTFLPAIAGLVIDHLQQGLDYLFLFVALSGVLTIFTASQLTEVRLPSDR